MTLDKAGSYLAGKLGEGGKVVDEVAERSDVDRAAPGRRRLTDIVREHITRQIVAGSLVPGDAIPSEAAIAAQLKVSKPVVREALRELAALGMVEIRHGRATEIKALDHEPLVQFFGLATRTGDTGLTELMELVRAIESDAAALAAEKYTAEEMEKLSAVMVRLEAASHEHFRWDRAQLDFHLVILEASKNELMTFVYTALQQVIVAQKLFIHSQFHLRDPKASFRRQQEIFEAIRARDAEAARTAMRRHFDVAIGIVRMVMAQRSQAPAGEG